MITIRKSNDRGLVNNDWLSSRHTFSFGHYYDPEHMGFGPLRVINQDQVKAGGGFGTHGHKNMEIISYVLEGVLAHKDNTGNSTLIKPGDVQRMTAGSGIMHSEYNPSPEHNVRFLQIWIEPNADGLPPGYEQKHFEASALSNQLRLVVSSKEHEGAVYINQDVDLYAGNLEQGLALSHTIKPQRGVWVQVVKGQVQLNEHVLAEGDGAAIENISDISLTALSASEVLLFDLAMNGKEL